MPSDALLDVAVAGERVIPRYLTPRDETWVAALCDEIESCVGLSKEEVEDRLAQLVCRAPRVRAWRAMMQLLLRQQGYEVSSSKPPPELRRELFRRAAAAPDTPPETLLDQAAAALGISPAALVADLYADIPAHTRLKPLAAPQGTRQLVERYNLALAQGLLLRSEQLSLQLGGLAKGVLRFARLKGLICQAERSASGGVVLHLSGPLALFHQTTKYGHAMAAWLPVVLRAPRWRLEARCRLRDQRLCWLASEGDPIGTTHALLKRFDSKVEARFFREMRRLAPSWRIEREAEVLELDRRIVTADFVLIDDRRDISVAMEIVGFWTPAYLANKFAALRALPRERPWIVCLDETLAAGHGPLPPHIPVFPFRRHIDVPAFLTFLEDHLARAPLGRWVAPSKTILSAPSF